MKFNKYKPLSCAIATISHETARFLRLFSNSIVYYLAVMAAGIIPTYAHAMDCNAPVPSMETNGLNRPIAAEDLLAIRDIGPVSVSPEGGRIAFQIRRAVPDTNEYCLGMFVMDLSGGVAPRQVDSGGEFIIARWPQRGFLAYPSGFPQAIVPQWSPDGQWIAFLKRTDGITQLWRASARGDGASPVTTSATDVEVFAWSLNSRSLTYGSRPVILEFNQAVEREARQGFLYDDRINPAMGVQPLLQVAPREFFTVDLDSPAARSASPSETALIGSTPDSGSAVSSDTAMSRAGWRAQVERSGLRSQDAAIRISDPTGREHPCPTSECRDSIRGIWWSEDGLELRFLRHEGWGNSRTALYGWDARTNALRRLLLTDDSIADCQPVRDELVCAHEGSIQPRRLVVITPATGHMRELLDPNPEFRSFRLQPPRRLYWRNELGFEAYGDLVLPPNHRAGMRHPLIIVQYSSRGFLRGGSGDEYPIQLFAARGNAVLSVNRPMNFSDTMDTADYDERRRVNAENWVDLRSVFSSLEAGVDLAIAEGSIDPARIGITGMSNGSASLEYALVNSRRYVAASVSALSGQTCFSAMLGPANADFNRRGGRPGFTDPNASAYWREGSVSDSPDRVHTPLLIQVSESEFLCPLRGHSALRELNRPVEMFVFPGEFHGKWQPAHRLAIYRRNAQWFDFWLRQHESSDPLDPNQYVRWREMRDNQCHRLTGDQAPWYCRPAAPATP